MRQVCLGFGRRNVVVVVFSILLSFARLLRWCALRCCQMEDNEGGSVDGLPNGSFSQGSMFGWTWWCELWRVEGQTERIGWRRAGRIARFLRLVSGHKTSIYLSTMGVWYGLPRNTWYQNKLLFHNNPISGCLNQFNFSCRKSQSTRYSYHNS